MTYLLEHYPVTTFFVLWILGIFAVGFVVESFLRDLRRYIQRRK